MNGDFLEPLTKPFFVAEFAGIQPPFLNSCESSYRFCQGR